ncbi:lysoplasmalogenase [Umezawaea endophytica]|uniref:Lysoplasmalogenase n=1 Tax=Umezawaea endophytica TaxID=1654476 RepID=A0A9X2VI79_9PSEU|nr:lysoplasmalogenase [Umezawaea endophytica]MCS7477093.1 lysoplasmalogenase [Umezawaea endophytica]
MARSSVLLCAGALFGVLSIGHLVAQLVGASVVATITQCLLMPVLAAVVWFATTGAPRARLVRLVLVALVFSWLGDSVPGLLSGDARFLAMVGLFLCAQVVYVVAFWPWRRLSVLRRPALAGYLLAFGALLAGCAPGAGGLLVPVIVYGLCLTLMAVLATGVNRLVAVGGALFFVSDGLIALDAFAEWYNPPAPGFWVMLTYLSGQALIAGGVSWPARTGSLEPSSTAR